MLLKVGFLITVPQQRFHPSHNPFAHVCSDVGFFFFFFLGGGGLLVACLTSVDDISVINVMYIDGTYMCKGTEGEV